MNLTKIQEVHDRLENDAKAIMRTSPEIPPEKAWLIALAMRLEAPASPVTRDIAQAKGEPLPDIDPSLKQELKEIREKIQLENPPDDNDQWTYFTVACNPMEQGTSYVRRILKDYYGIPASVDSVGTRLTIHLGSVCDVAAYRTIAREASIRLRDRLWTVGINTHAGIIYYKDGKEVQ